MKKYYPVMLDISNKNCLVVGGGIIGHRKILSLLHYGACVNLVSPDICSQLEELVASGQIKWTKDNYNSTYLENIFLVIAATNNSEINKEIYFDAKNKKILINVVDTPEFCDFISPAVLEHGDLTIAVSTNGKNPPLAKKVRDDLRSIFDEK
jgi:precorrin-2 dehydrogenase/sirohydrochlorin ferrochelatase